MEKSEKHEYNPLVLVSIVAIFAICGMIFLTSGTNNTAQLNEQNMVGEATYKNPVAQTLLEPVDVCGNSGGHSCTTGGCPSGNIDNWYCGCYIEPGKDTGYCTNYHWVPAEKIITD